MDVENTFKKIGYNLVRKWTSITDRGMYTFERVYWNDSRNDSNKTIFGCIFEPDKITWYCTDVYYGGSSTYCIGFEEVFEKLNKADKKFVIMNLDIFNRS